MSGLVTGLQNRAQRFESASDLKKFPPNKLYLSLLGGFVFAWLQEKVSQMCLSCTLSGQRVGLFDEHMIINGDKCAR